ncbi:unnamed protein product [Musa acuminata subsp. burmannicoides]
MGEIDRGCKKRSAEERAEGFGDVSSDEGEHLITTSFASVPVKLVRVGLVKPGSVRNTSLQSENPRYYHNQPKHPSLPLCYVIFFLGAPQWIGIRKVAEEVCFPKPEVLCAAID